MSLLQSRCGIVTGAANGIGREIALALAAEGASVAAVDKDREGLAGLMSEKGHIHPMVWDLTALEEIDKLVNTVELRLAPIDFLVNCAAVCVTRPLLDVDADSWKKVFQLNVHAAFFLMQACANQMVKREKGSIVNVASISGFLPKPDQVAYGASKAALVSITRSAAAALGPHGIRVNAVAPGVIDTPMTSKIRADRAAKRGVSEDRLIEDVVAITPLGRIGDPKDVAAAVLHLVSDQSSFITGQTIDVCGGMLMR